MVTQQITEFIQHWFSKFDALPDSPTWFLPHLASNVQFDMPEGVFNGIEGFYAWYQIVKASFKPHCQHIVQDIQIEPLTETDTFIVKLKVNLIADTYLESDFNGEQVNIDVDETWHVRLINQKNRYPTL